MVANITTPTSNISHTAVRVPTDFFLSQLNSNIFFQKWVPTYFANAVLWELLYLLFAICFFNLINTFYNCQIEIYVWTQAWYHFIFNT